MSSNRLPVPAASRALTPGSVAPRGWIPIGYSATRGTFSGYSDNRHLITFGPTRSGKGATVIQPALLLAQHSVVCIDPKGQNAAVAARRRREMGQDVHLLNPFNELGLGTSRFNPLAHLSIDDPNIVADVSSLAEALILSEGKDPHWADSARSLVRVLLLHLIETKRGKATLSDLRKLVTLPQGNGADDAFGGVIFDALHSPYPFIHQPAAQFENKSKEVESIISTARTQTTFLDDPNVARVLSYSYFDMMQLKNTPTTVFLILPGRYLEAYARFFRLLVTSAIDQLTARPGGYETLFILDEFASLQNLGAVAKAFGFAAGYNVQLWPFLQDLPQLKSIYGERWESFLANAGMTQFFTPVDLTTAKYLEERCGTKEVRTRTETLREISVKEAKGGFTGIQYSFGKERIPVAQIEMLMSLRPDEQIVFFAGLHAPARLERLPYFHNPRLHGLYDPDPFHG